MRGQLTRRGPVERCNVLGMAIYWQDISNEPQRVIMLLRRALNGLDGVGMA